MKKIFVCGESISAIPSMLREADSHDHHRLL